MSMISEINFPLLASGNENHKLMHKQKHA